MLHNSGYGNQGDMPVNMGVSNTNHVGMTLPLNSGKVSNIINNIPTRMPQYSSAEMAGSTHGPLSVTPNLVPYANLINERSNFSYPLNTHTLFDHNFFNYHSGMLQKGINLPNSESYDLLEEKNKVSNTDFRHEIRKMPINVPQVPKCYSIFEQKQENVQRNINYENSVTNENSSNLRKSFSICLRDQILSKNNSENQITNNKTLNDSKLNSEVLETNNKLEITTLEPMKSSQIPIQEEVLKNKRTNLVVEWTDTDYHNPFLKDFNGYEREDVNDNFDIIDGQKSSDSAVSIAKHEHTDQETTKRKLFTCATCNLIFIHPKRYLIHHKWHTFGQLNDKRKLLKMEKELRKNEKKRLAAAEKECDDDQSGFPCPYCDKIFTTRKHLRYHKSEKHKGMPKECKLCKQVFENTAAVRDHIKTSHKEESKSKFICDECPKTFSFLHSLQRHQAIHREKIHACSICNKKFGSELQLGVHIKTHDKKEPAFHCSYCGKGFHQSYTLQIHERTHRNERPFECNICHSTYPTNSGLQRHLKVSHSESKPHECPTCHRSFSTARIRDRHVAREHSDRESLTFQCQLCDMRCAEQALLTKHVSNVHRKDRRKNKCQILSTRDN